MFVDRLAVLALAVAVALMGLCGVVPSGTGHVPTAAAAGRSFWVSPDGRDSNPGTQALPFETIQRGVDTAGPRDTVFVMDGSYTATTFPMVGFDHGGAKGAPLTVAAASGATPVLAGTSEYRYGFILDTGVSFVTISGFTMHGFSGNGVQLNCGPCTARAHRKILLQGLDISAGGTGVLATAGSHISLVDSRIYDNSEIGLDCTPGPCVKLLVSGTHIEDNTGYDWSDGVGVETGRGVRILDSVAAGNSGDGFDSKAYNTAVVDSQSLGNGRDGIKLWHGDSQIVDCVSAGNGLLNVVLDGSGSFKVANTLVASGGTAARDYGMTAGYDGGAGMTLQMFNTMFADNNGTALFVGDSVNFAREDHDLFFTGAPENSAIAYHGIVYEESELNKGKWTADMGLGVGTFSAVPAFVSDTDYHLQAGSPGVDAGTSNGAPATALDDVARPQGSGYDIGPYER